MQVAIVGPPSAGKTTVFNLLTNGESSENGRAGLNTGRAHASIPGKASGYGKQEVSIRMARVPDDRISYLSGMFKPRKTTYAQIQVTDVPGLTSANILPYLRTVDAVVYVVRTFDEAPGVIPAGYEIDPVNEVETLSLDLVLADLQAVQNRIERLNGSRRRTEDEQSELELLREAETLLEGGKRLDRMGLSPEDETRLKGYALLTLRPAIVVANLSEDQFLARDYPGKDRLSVYAGEQGIPLIELSARIESEIQELPDGEREAFISEYGIEEPAIALLSRTAYEVLGLISFFTVGEDEVKAWPVSDGTTAKKAAGKIHSDIEKGFIRAEVISFKDLKQCGSVGAAKSNGLYRLEGKDYVVKDGDIINFRFSP